MRGADGGNGTDHDASHLGGPGGNGGTWTVTIAKPTSGKLFLYIGSSGGSLSTCSGEGADGGSSGGFDEGVVTGGSSGGDNGIVCPGGAGGGATFVMDTSTLGTFGNFDPAHVLAVAGGGGGGGAGAGGGGGCQYPQTGTTLCVPETAGVIRQAHAARHAKHDAKPHRSAPPTPAPTPTAAAPKAIAVPASLTKPDPPKHKRVHIAALGQGGQVQVVFPGGNTPPINPPPPAGHHGSSSNDPGVDASNDPDRQRPDTDQMVCSPLAGICSVNPPPGANTVFTISASGGNESATLFGTLYGGSHPSCPGYTPVTDDWVAFGFRDASSGRSWHKAGTLTTRQSLGHAGAAAQLRQLQICFAAPYRFRTAAGYRTGRDGDGEWTGVLPSCRAAAAPCISHRSLVRQGPGWVARGSPPCPGGGAP
jgi:hypothetical protein